MKTKRKNLLFLSLLLIPWPIVALGTAMTSRGPEAQRIGRLSPREAEGIAIALCQRLYQQSPDSLLAASLSGKQSDREQGMWSIECQIGRDRVFFLMAADSGRVVRVARDPGSRPDDDPAGVSPHEAIPLAGRWLEALGVRDAVYERSYINQPLDLFFKPATARSPSARRYRIKIDRADGRVNHFLR